MPTFDPSHPLAAILAAAATGFAVGILPVGLAEVAAVAIGMVVPPGLSLGMLAAFTLAHVAAKLPWYAVGTWADRVRHPRAAALTARARALVAAYPGYGVGVLALSALLSVPPFHLASVAAGLVRLPFGRFVLVCLAGRAVRFGALASVPGVVRAWIA